MNSAATGPVLELTGLTIAATGKGGRVRSTLVRDLHLSIRPGEMVGLVGESGSGKSLTAAAVSGLLPGGLRVTAGRMVLKGTDLGALPEREMRRLRGKAVAYIFQNYQGSFTPFLTIGRQMVEAFRCHHRAGYREAKERAMQWLDRVQLPAARAFDSYPFQLSGGQLQRASLAAALMLEPALIIADEPTTALDVLTGERVLDLLGGLQKESNCAVLLISHDLTQVLKRADRMAVMYGGRLMETGPTASLRRNPLHPYTQLLLQARPRLAERMPERLTTIPGEAGSVAGTGCPFALRCPLRTAQCEQVPCLQTVGESHQVACHRVNAEGRLEHEALAGGYPG